MEERAPLPDPPVKAPAAATIRPRRPMLSTRKSCRAGDAVHAGQPEAAVPVRTALSVELRDGQFCVFMPPVERLEDYLELLAAVEATAAELRPTGARRGLPAAARPAAERHQGDARPRRDRGQHPAGRELARGGRDYAERSTRKPVLRGSAPTSS